MVIVLGFFQAFTPLLPSAIALRTEHSPMGSQQVCHSIVLLPEVSRGLFKCVSGTHLFHISAGLPHILSSILDK